MIDYYKIRDREDLVKNAGSKAVLSIDTTGLDKYREERDRRIRLTRVVEDTDRLKEDVAEIKSMLKQLLENKKK